MRRIPIPITGPTVRRAVAIAGVAVVVAGCSVAPVSSVPPTGPASGSISSASASVPPSPGSTPTLATSSSLPTLTPSAELPERASEPRWTAGGTMVVPRRSHVATLLDDGRVLVVGGVDAAGSAVDLAEIYDPETGRWRPAGSMRLARFGATATRLEDGTVLVAGGWTPDDELRPTASTERYDPAAGSWSPGPMLHEVRAGHTATVLDDGSLLVAGGGRYNGGNGDPGAGVEILRPGASEWVIAAPMLEARGDHTATLLVDGTVLVVGGIGRDTDEAAPFNTTLPTTERYDPRTDRWAATDRLAAGRAGHHAALLLDGTVLLSRMGREGSAAVFDPGLGAFRPTGDLIHGRFSHTSTRLPDGDVLVVGGDPIEDQAAGRTAERYDPADGTWSLTAAMSGPRRDHDATALGDGRVLVSGGVDLAGEVIDVAEIYDPSGP
jgi:hypothetical protein